MGEVKENKDKDAVEAAASRGQKSEVGLSELQGVAVGDRFN